VIERLSEPEGFLAVDDPFLERSPLGEDQGQIAGSHHHWKSGEAEPFPAEITLEQPQNFHEELLSPSIVAGTEARHTKVEISRHLKWNIVSRLGQSLRALAEAERFRRMTSYVEVVGHVDGHLPESPLIVECRGQALGFPETVEDPLEFSERKE
jgi:hypothetical protein